MRCNIDYAPLWKRRLYLRQKQLPEAVLYRRHKRAMVSQEAFPESEFHGSQAVGVMAV